MSDKVPGDLIEKDPDSIEPYGFDWTAYLSELGEDVLIDTSEWFITTAADESPVGLTIDDDEIEAGNLKTKAMFSGGTRSVKYRVTNRIVTDSVPAVTDDRSVWFKVTEK